MTTTASLPPDYFERMFAGDPDPWQFETSPYESGKYNISMTSLGGRHYTHALEVGCANGLLTQRLASHCNTIVAIDVSDTALSRARARNSDSNSITFAKIVFPQETPVGRFDLIVLSEVVYYWNDADIAAAGAWIASHLDGGGDLLLVHWTGETDYPQTGDGAVTKLQAALLGMMSVVKADRHAKFRLDLWRAA